MSVAPVSPPASSLATQALLDTAAMRLANALPMAAPAAPALAPADSAPSAATPSPQPTALAVATQAAVTQQASLAPALANLAAALDAPGLPAPVAQAAQQVLAFAMPLDPAPTGADVQTAMASSGLLLESILATTGAPPPADLKAALLNLRQTLQAALADEPAAPPTSAPTTTATIGSAAPAPTSPTSSTSPPTPAPMATPGMVAQLSAALSANEPPPVTAPPETPTTAAAAAPPAPPSQTALLQPPPSPPYRDGPLQPQPAAPPTLAVDAPPAALARALLTGVTSALARQALFQLASVPAAPQAAGQAQSPQWLFEIPIATPQGPAVMPFEITRDQHGASVPQVDEAPSWRARFALETPGAGVVHASVTVRGGRARVGLWAEQPDLAAALDADRGALANDLSGQALDAAVSVFPGQPPSAMAPAGRFLDKAL